MIRKELFEIIKEKYGDVASWAVWAEAGRTPKSNMGDMSIFDIQKNPLLLDLLKTSVVMIGLNFSRPVAFTEPFQNFHDPSPYANDFKIRYAFKDTQFYGAYMTDVIKNTVMLSSQDMRSYLKSHIEIIHDSILSLQRELNDIEANEPLMLIFGNDAYNLLNEYLPKKNYSKLIKITHYSHFINKENYKKEILDQIESAI